MYTRMSNDNANNDNINDNNSNNNDNVNYYNGIITTHAHEYCQMCFHPFVIDKFDSLLVFRASQFV